MKENISLFVLISQSVGGSQVCLWAEGKEPAGKE